MNLGSTDVQTMVPPQRVATDHLILLSTLTRSFPFSHLFLLSEIILFMNFFLCLFMSCSSHWKLSLEDQGPHQPSSLPYPQIQHLVSSL